MSPSLLQTPEPNRVHLSVVRFPQNPLPRSSPTTRPQQETAPVADSTSPEGDEEQRSKPIFKACGVGQFLDRDDEVVAAADCLKAFLRWHENKLPEGIHPPCHGWIVSQEEDLRDIAGDIADVCNDLIPGSPAARGYPFIAYLEPFDPPPLPGGSDQTKPVSQKANTCSSRVDEQQAEAAAPRAN